MYVNEAGARYVRASPGRSREVVKATKICLSSLVYFNSSTNPLDLIMSYGHPGKLGVNFRELDDDRPPIWPQGGPGHTTAWSPLRVRLSFQHGSGWQCLDEALYLDIQRRLFGSQGILPCERLDLEPCSSYFHQSIEVAKYTLLASGRW
ncbi:hypothetical protein VNO77_04177 [Canavalia gladiata]|uniref:Uncharacterized protein n=1 Tax=Canavalia gladiata TaxID=3824 RepID=A0AAN9N182_CANGL